MSLSGLRRDLPPAYERLGAADGLVVMISLSLELPFVNKARAADARRADLGVEIRRRRIALQDLTGSLLERLTLEEVDTQ